VQLGADPRFLALALASGVPFNGMFLYVLSAPTFLGQHLGLRPEQYFVFFVLTIACIVAGAWCSGRLAGRIAPPRQIGLGFAIMAGVSVLNVALNALFQAHVAWSLLPVAVFAFGWSLMVPVVTLLVLDLVPEVAFDKEKLLQQIKEGEAKGKKHAIITICEHVTDVNALAKDIEAMTGRETRATILGHIQRGGSPTARDRIMSSRMGAFAVEQLLAGQGGRCVGIQGNEMVHHDIIDCIENLKRPFNQELYDLSTTLF
jgi:hypothetical protein